MTRNEIDRRLLQAIQHMRADGASDDNLCGALAGALCDIKANEYHGTPRNKEASHEQG